MYGEYEFDDGQTVLLACSFTHFTITATTALPAYTSSAVETTPTETSTPSLTLPNHVITPTTTLPLSTPLSTAPPAQTSSSPAPASTTPASGSSLGPGPWTAIGVTVFIGLLAAAISIATCLSNTFQKEVRRVAAWITCGCCGSEDGGSASPLLGGHRGAHELSQMKIRG